MTKKAHDSRSSRAAKQRRRSRGSRWRTAATSDIHELYEQSVQDPQAECEFLDQAWREYHAGSRALPRTIREDFCGTAAVCRQWVRRRPGNIAFGIDLDPSVLAWARGRGMRGLGAARRQRITLIEGDVRSARARPADCVLALNFSYFIFKTRREMLGYFQAARRHLVHGGLLILDTYGGSDSFRPMREPRDLDGFTYIWDQHSYNPVTGEVINHIHFKFPDGTRIRKAFSYDWRLWTLPELQELMREAGFRNVAVYWEGTDEETGSGDGEFKKTTQGESCAGWVAYIVGQK